MIIALVYKAKLESKTGHTSGTGLGYYCSSQLVLVQKVQLRLGSLFDFCQSGPE